MCVKVSRKWGRSFGGKQEVGQEYEDISWKWVRSVRWSAGIRAEVSWGQQELGQLCEAIRRK